MRLPLISKSTKPFYPRDNKCPVCASEFSNYDPAVVVIGGALKKIDKDTFGMSDDIFGFLDIYFHGSQSTRKGEGHFFVKEIVKHAKQGQFELSFCSTQCFRTFANKLIDEMEKDLLK
jgi:hypothetical protein